MSHRGLFLFTGHRITDGDYLVHSIQHNHDERNAHDKYERVRLDVPLRQHLHLRVQCALRLPRDIVSVQRLNNMVIRVGRWEDLDVQVTCLLSPHSLVRLLTRQNT